MSCDNNHWVRHHKDLCRYFTSKVMIVNSPELLYHVSSGEISSNLWHSLSSFHVWLQTDFYRFGFDYPWPPTSTRPIAPSSLSVVIVILTILNCQIEHICKNHKKRSFMKKNWINKKAYHLNLSYILPILVYLLLVYCFFFSLFYCWVK